MRSRSDLRQRLSAGVHDDLQLQPKSLLSYIYMYVYLSFCVYNTASSATPLFACL